MTHSPQSKSEDLARLGTLRQQVAELERHLGIDRVPRPEVHPSIASEAYSAIERHCTDLISVHASNGDYRFASANAEELTGFRPEELLGRNAYEFFHPDDLERIARDHAGHDAGEVGSVQYRLRRADGSYRWVETRSRARRSSEGVEEIVCVTRDIDAHKRLEELRRNELELVRNSLVRCDQMAVINDAVATCAHELGNLVGAYRMTVHMLPTELGPDCALSEQTMERLVRLGGDMEQHVRALRTASMPGGDELASLDLTSVATDCLAMVQQANLDRDLPARLRRSDAPAPITGNRLQIEQLILNLLLNAVDASVDVEDRMGIEVEISNDRVAAHATLTVRDHGCGIPDSDLERIFQPHFTTKGPDHGTGLGLSVVKQIARSHRATVEVDSVVGQGTEFRVMFPRRL